MAKRFPFAELPVVKTSVKNPFARKVSAPVLHPVEVILGEIVDCVVKECEPILEGDDVETLKKKYERAKMHREHVMEEMISLEERLIGARRIGAEGVLDAYYRRLDVWKRMLTNINHYMSAVIDQIRFKNKTVSTFGFERS